MNTLKSIKIKDIQAKFLDYGGDAVGIFLPGTSGGIFEGKYDYLVEIFKKNKCSFLMPEIWKDATDLGSMSLQEIYHDLDDIVSFLSDRGLNRILGIGKSFGATVLLGYKDVFSELILLAPPIAVGHKDKVLKLLTIHMQNVSMTDLVVDGEHLENIAAHKVLIIGSKDDIVSLDSIKDLASILRNAEIKVVDGGDHSFVGTTQRNALIDIIYTIVHSFCRKDIIDENSNSSPRMEV